MARKCTVCSHPQREAIDAALCDPSGVNRHIASQFGVTEQSLKRHKVDHLPARLAQAQAARVVAQADDLLAQVRDLQARTLAILTKAENGRDLRVALGAIAEARRNLELLGKLAGELQQEGTVNIVVNAEWVAIQVALMNVLAPYPDVKLKVVEALRYVSNKS